MFLRSLSAMVGVGCDVGWVLVEVWSLLFGCVANGLMNGVWWVDVWCDLWLVMLLFAHSEATLDRPEAMTLEAIGSFRCRASRNIHMLVQ
jgi:hypothetical protein